MSTNKTPPKTREELALGVLNPKTGKRKGGYVNMYRAMRQWQEAIASGEKSEDDLIEAAFEYADRTIHKRGNPNDSEDVIALAEEDAEWRLEQEARYRAEYDWNDSNDESSLQQLLSLEHHVRVLDRELARATLSIKDRVELTKELRNFTTNHADLQKKLGIDKPGRESKSRTEDPMAELRKQINAGADYVRKLREEWAEVAPEVKSIEELIARAQHHSGLPQDWIRATLAAHSRLLGLDSTDVDTE